MNRPKAHSWHTALARSTRVDDYKPGKRYAPEAKKPLLQFVQLAWPRRNANLPNGHGVHAAVAPGRSWYVPTAHGWQTCWPTLSVKVPLRR